VQNVFETVIAPNQPPGSSSLHLLKQLNWLLVEWRIKFKIVMLKFKTFKTGLPPYLAHHLCSYAPTRVLCSLASKLLQVPHTNHRFGSCSIHVSAPILGNHSSQHSFPWISSNFL